MGGGSDLVSIVTMVVALIGAGVAVWCTQWPERTRRHRWWLATIWILAIVVCGLTPVIQKHLWVVDGTFEWQWAGEKWYGTVTIGTGKDGERTAAAKLSEVTKEVKGDKVTYALKAIPVLESRSGKFHGDKRHFNLTIYADQMVKGKKVPVDLEADLNPIEAYAGIVRFVGNGQSCAAGDIILVKTGLKVAKVKAGEVPIRLVRYTSGMRFH